ncbi:acyl--CoA ligase [Anaerolineae bacterium CFX8]|nr:acyl--CoA ligase [Anaerolineae bacterium CFX8]
MSLDERTLDLIRAARAVNGVPGDRYKIPFRNIRQVLSLHARVSPEKTFLIHYDAEGNREELSYAEFNARVHQTAHLLRHDLDVRRGDRVATIGYNHSDLVIIYFACWIIGAAVAPQNVAEDDRRIAFILRNSRAVVCFVRQEYLERARQIIYGTEEGLGAPNIRRIIQIGGQPDGETLFFHQAVQNLPNTTNEGESPRQSLTTDLLNTAH